MTLEEAQSLQHGQIIYHVFARNADGTPQRWRVVGQARTWKRDPDRVEVQVRHGMHDVDVLDQWSLPLFYLTEDEADAWGRAWNDSHAALTNGAPAVER